MVVRAFVGDVFVEEEAFVPLEKMMVVKGLRSPEIVKTPSPVWRLQLVGRSLFAAEAFIPTADDTGIREGVVETCCCTVCRQS